MKKAQDGMDTTNTSALKENSTDRMASLIDWDVTNSQVTKT